MRENDRNERPKNGADTKPCLSDVYKNSTRARRRQADVPFSGRSMVEMLGVLAIIGVLSVGAIAGYSKAMMKYKLNLMTQDLSFLIGELIPFSKEFISYSKGTNLFDIINKLNLIPSSFSVQNKTFYDSINNQINISTCTSVPCWKLSYILKNNSLNAQFCFNLISYLQNYHNKIYRISLNGYFLWGDDYCSQVSSCLINFDMSTLDDTCKRMCGSNCMIEVGFE